MLLQTGRLTIKYRKFSTLWISCCHSENFDFPFLNQGVRTTTWNRRNSAVEKYVFRVFRNIGPSTNKNPELRKTYNSQCFSSRSYTTSYPPTLHYINSELRNSDRCHLCAEKQTITHLFVTCPNAQLFWTHFSVWWREKTTLRSRFLKHKHFMALQTPCLSVLV